MNIKFTNVLQFTLSYATYDAPLEVRSFREHRENSRRVAT